MKWSHSKDTPLKIPYNEPGASADITARLLTYMQDLPAEKRIAVVCIGTDRSTGDALGPLVGTQLSRLQSPCFDLYGTLEEPVHAMNLEETLFRINREIASPFVIGIDACLGQVSSVGSVQVGSGPVRPGAGVNKNLPPVGHIHMTGIVNVGGFMEYFVLQNTRLHLVMNMAELIASSLYTAISRSQAFMSSAATQE